jgi:23S rRNA (pseudouridine1915-N3)-methyltransferase
MRVTVHAVAGKMPRWVEAGVDDYQRRLPREIDLRFNDLPLARRGAGSSGEALAAREGEALLAALRDGDHCVALEPTGTPWSTERLAKELQRWMMGGQPVSLLVGGPDGLAPACLERVTQRWSLGPLTLPHTLVRVVLAEQLYRAWTITIGHPYHRG